MALNRLVVLALILWAPTTAFAQFDAGVDASVDAAVDAGPDPCGDACGPDLRCVELDGEWYCGQCALGETQDCPQCPGSTQNCGADLYWERCECPGCGEGPLCGPGLECIEVDGASFCGICRPGDERNCSNGCGPGVETCQNDLFWGRCTPTAPVTCLPGDELPCDSQCGAGHMECDTATCEWSGQCVPDALIQCLPGTTTSCTAGISCAGNQTCLDSCNWSECVPVTECHECGDNVVDDGEDCDDGNLVPGDGCSDFCEWEDARPFQSCQCRAGAGVPGPAGAAAALLVAAFVLIRRRRMR